MPAHNVIFINWIINITKKYENPQRKVNEKKSFQILLQESKWFLEQDEYFVSLVSVVFEWCMNGFKGFPIVLVSGIKYVV